MDPLAAWGAATGTLAVGVQTANHLRDRSKLSVGAGWDSQLPDIDTLWIRVANQGRQPTTLIEAGFLVKTETQFEVIERAIRGTGSYHLRWDDGNPVLLRPGEVHQYRHRLTKWPETLVHADEPLRPFVLDAANRESWGMPGPFLRMMMDSGWHPSGPMDARLTERSPEPLKAEPVTAGWKLWRPSHERKPVTGLERVDETTVRIRTHIGSEAE